jgi:surface protein
MIPLFIGSCAQANASREFPDDFTDITVTVDSPPRVMGVFVAEAALAIDWGDGSPVLFSAGGYLEASHEYTSVGTYNMRVYLQPSTTEMSIGAAFTSFQVNSFQSDIQRLSFQASELLTSVPSSIPSTLVSAENMFNGCTSFNSANLESWDTENITNMTGMFNGASSFNRDLSGWCVSSIGSEPTNFATGATAWVLPKPVWGTCPG